MNQTKNRNLLVVQHYISNRYSNEQLNVKQCCLGEFFIIVTVTVTVLWIFDNVMKM